jgi:hypothetical protein
MYTSVGRVNSKLCKLYYSNVNGNSKGNETTVNESISGGGDHSNNNNDSEGNKPNTFYKKIGYIKKFCDIILLKKISNTAIVNADNGNSSSSSSGSCNILDYYKDYIKMIEYFIKKIRKINDLPNAFEQELVSKSFSEQFEEKIKLHNVSKFINWIFL